MFDEDLFTFEDISHSVLQKVALIPWGSLKCQMIGEVIYGPTAEDKSMSLSITLSMVSLTRFPALFQLDKLC